MSVIEAIGWKALKDSGCGGTGARRNRSKPVFRVEGIIALLMRRVLTDAVAAQQYSGFCSDRLTVQSDDVKDR
jgi:hypothetical protein